MVLFLRFVLIVSFLCTTWCLNRALVVCAQVPIRNLCKNLCKMKFLKNRRFKVFSSQSKMFCERNQFSTRDFFHAWL